MADDITQSFSLDASDALQTLTLLDSSFVKMQESLRSTTSTFSTFNTGAGKTVSALIQITNRANEAATALNKLNTIKNPPSVSGGGLPAVGGAASSTPLLTGSAAAAAMNQLLGQTASQATAAGSAVNNLGNNAAKSLDGARRAGSGFALSLETITRVIGTQLIVRALNSIRTAVEDSFQGFINFNRAIAEVQTIAAEPVEKLAADVRTLSDEFNAPILDVAKAKYEILSNGFITAADSTTVLTAALKFAKVGISDVSQAADLISTTLNAYSKSADEAEVISAKLFKTIELGRVIGSELATSFGRVAPIAHEVGVSEDEVLAGFSSITIGGVKASEAATQLRASLTALLKPSDAMKEAIHSLGFETGEQVIQAKGYQGALQALIGTTDGSSTSIAKLFPNVRAINGVLREAGSGAQIFQDHLKAIQESSRELLNQKFELRISSDAEKVSTDLNKIKNFFTVDLGSSLVGGAASVLSFGRGVDTLINAMDRASPVVATAVAGLVAYNAITLTTTGVNKLLTLSFKEAGAASALLGGSITALIAIMGAVQLGKFIGSEITASFDAAFEQQKEQANQLLEFQKNQAEARSNIDKLERDEKFKGLFELTGEIRKQYFEQTADAKEANDKLLEEDKATVEGIVAQHEKLAQDLKRSAIEAANEVTSSQKRSSDVQSQLDDQRFNFQNEHFDSVTQSIRDQQRAQELASKAATDLGKATNSTERDAALAVFSRAESYAKIGASTAAASKNSTAQFQAEQNIEGVLQKRLDAEQQYQKTQEKEAQLRATAFRDEQARADELKKLGKTFLDNANLFDKKGNLLPQDQLDKNLKTAQDALAAFKEKAFGPGSKFNFGDLLNVSSLEQQLNQTVSKGQISRLSASDQALKDLRQQVQGSLNASAFLIQIAPDPTKLIGKSLPEQLQEFTNQAKALQEGSTVAGKNADIRLDAERKIATFAKQAEDSYKSQESSAQRLFTLSQVALRDVLGSPLGSSNREAIVNQLSDVRRQIQDAIKTPNIGASVVNGIAGQLRDIQKVAPASVGFDLNAAGKEFELLKQIFEEKQRILALPPERQDATTLRQTQQLLEESQQTTQSFKATSTEVQNTNTSVGSAATSSVRMGSALEGAVSSSSQLASNFRNIATQAAAAAASSQQLAGGQSSDTVTAALGGLIRHYATGGHVAGLGYFAAGGAAKGTDTIPALLSQDEMVINARSSRRFLPQLQAIQAGIQPSFNSRPGDTFHIGDINITADPNPRVTARQVIDEIRREQRRGTSRSLN